MILILLSIHVLHPQISKFLWCHLELLLVSMKQGQLRLGWHCWMCPHRKKMTQQPKEHLLNIDKWTLWPSSVACADVLSHNLLEGREKDHGLTFHSNTETRRQDLLLSLWPKQPLWLSTLVLDWYMTQIQLQINVKCLLHTQGFCHTFTQNIFNRLSLHHTWAVKAFFYTACYFRCDISGKPGFTVILMYITTV